MNCRRGCAAFATHWASIRLPPRGSWQFYAPLRHLLDLSASPDAGPPNMAMPSRVGFSTVTAATFQRPAGKAVGARSI